MKKKLLKRIISISMIFVICFSLNCINILAAENSVKFVDPHLVESETVVYLPNFDKALYYYSTMFTQSQNWNNCGPTAAANVLSYYKCAKGLNLYSGNITQSIYNQICSDCNYVNSGGTSIANISNGIKKFAKRAGYSCDFDGYLLAHFSDIKRDINRGYPILMSANQHMYVIVGYSEGGANGNLVYVINGWENNMTGWISYNPSPYSVTLGSINIY